MKRAIMLFFLLAIASLALAEILQQKKQPENGKIESIEYDSRNTITKTQYDLDYEQANSYENRLSGRTQEGIKESEGSPKSSLELDLSDHVVSGHYAYLLTYFDGLHIRDISDPVHMPEIGVYRYGILFAYTLDMKGHHVYIGSRNFKVLDISDPTLPVEVFTISGTGQIYDMTIQDDYLYYVDNTLKIIDISDPTSPTIEAVYVDELYASDFKNVCVSGDYAYLVSFAGLYVIDISDRSSPEAIGISYHIESATEIKVSGNYVYIASGEELGSSQLFVYDVSDPINPVQVVMDTLIIAKSLDIYENFVFIGDENFHIFDMIDPSSPVKIESHITPGNITSIDIADNEAVYWDHLDGIQILDIHHIISPGHYVTIQTGWNIISCPFELPITSDIISDIRIGDVFCYDIPTSAYSAIDSMSCGKGYWVLSRRDTVFSLGEMTPVDELTLQLCPGWNLIGGPNIDVPTDEIEDLPSIVPPIFSYNAPTGGYEIADTLKALKGYWILSRDSLIIELP